MIDAQKNDDSEMDPLARNSIKTHHKIIAHKLHMEDREYGDIWRSCCGLLIDRRLLTYLAQLLIIILIISFCIVQLIRLEECSGQQAYLGLLTLLIGILCPSPALVKDKRQNEHLYDDTTRV